VRVGAIGPEYTQECGENALAFEDWMERIAHGGTTWVNDDGGLETSMDARRPADEPARRTDLASGI